MRTTSPRIIVGALAVVLLGGACRRDAIDIVIEGVQPDSVTIELHNRAEETTTVLYPHRPWWPQIHYGENDFVVRVGDEVGTVRVFNDHEAREHQLRLDVTRRHDGVHATLFVNGERNNNVILRVP